MKIKHDNIIKKLFPADYKSVESSISACDKLSANMPVFEPSAASLDRIKSQMVYEMKIANRWKTGFKSICACAILLLCMGLTWQILVRPSDNKGKNSVFLAASLFNEVDENLLHGKLDIIETSLNITDNSKDSNLENAVLELEIQLINLNNDFWKG